MGGSGGNSDGDLFKPVENKSTENLDDIVAPWRYRGRVLTKEKNVFDDFMDLTLKRYDDLVRLHHDYETMLEKYTRVLMDEVESRVAVECVLRNMEILQVVIGEIHLQVLDPINIAERSDAVTPFAKSLSERTLQLLSTTPGLFILCIDIRI